MPVLTGSTTAYQLEATKMASYQALRSCLGFTYGLAERVWGALALTRHGRNSNLSTLQVKDVNRDTTVSGRIKGAKSPLPERGVL